MVLLHVKRSDKDTFLFDTPAATEVDVVLREVVAIHNLRQKIGRLAAQVEGLAAHGPMKVPEQQGLDDETPLLEDYDVKDGTTKARAPPERGAHFCPDPSERRTGNAPSPELAAVLTKTVEDAKALASERQVQMKVATTQKALADAVGNIRGAVMIAYPMGLPDYDAVRQILEEREAVDGAAGLEELEIEKASLWCFNKELQREKLLSECARNSPRAIRRAQFGARNSLSVAPPLVTTGTRARTRRRRWWRSCRRRGRARRSASPWCPPTSGRR